MHMLNFSLHLFFSFKNINKGSHLTVLHQTISCLGVPSMN
jgi:hypothetical protein